MDVLPYPRYAKPSVLAKKCQRGMIVRQPSQAADLQSESLTLLSAGRIDSGLNRIHVSDPPVIDGLSLPVCSFVARVQIASLSVGAAGL